jgi:hypothetical protein
MADRTKGPWEVRDYGAATVEVTDAAGRFVCDASRTDAPVIAAAPDLQEQLQRVYDALGGECFDWEPVRAALAKAGSTS